MSCLCRVGPGTPMGEVLRRYWLPVLTSEELPEPDCPPVRAKLLGEELVAFRDSDGNVGLIDNYCPHRRASLFFGRNEESGLRCVYHGWKYNVSGECVDMPSEPAESNFKDKVKIKAYPCVDKGGTIWTYMGPADLQPPFINFIALQYPDDHLITNRVQSDCNYIQSMEGNMDTSHISYLHRNLADLKMDDFDDGTDVIGFPHGQDVHEDPRFHPGRQARCAANQLRLALRRPAGDPQRPQTLAYHHVHLPHLPDDRAAALAGAGHPDNGAPR